MVKTYDKPRINNEWVSRVKNLMKESGLSTSQDLAYKSGISAGSLNQSMRGMHMPRQSTIEKIALALDTTAQFLLYGETQAVENKLQVMRKPDQLLRWLSNEVVDMERTEWVDVGNASVSPSGFAMAFNQTDMMPAFSPGDIIIFERVMSGDVEWRDLLLDRSLFVLALKKSLDLKSWLFGRLAKTCEGHYIESMNPQYPPVFIEDDYVLIGIAVHVIRDLKR